MRILHPLFVHLHIAFLVMAFIAMVTWLIRGLATSVFEDRIYRFARTNTWAGVVTVALSMIAGLRDGFQGTIARFDGPIGVAGAQAPSALRVGAGFHGVKLAA